LTTEDAHCGVELEAPGRQALDRNGSANGQVDLLGIGEQKLRRAQPLEL